ncbi:MAG: NAD(P)-binding domain-containing protein [Planctomycetota bacterium]|jgi:thioredoxin reductase/ferredoxin
MLGILGRYAKWLHLDWPAGTVEKLPEVREDGTTAVPGLRVVGDLTGIPLLKFAADSGARAVTSIKEESGFAPGSSGEVLDIAIIGAGVAGIAAAMEAKQHGLSFKVFEATEPFSTIVNFPKAKPIYTYPTDMVPAGKLTLEADVKEALVDELESQRREAGIEIVPLRIDRVERKGGEFRLTHGDGEIWAQRVIVAIGRSGNFRKLGVEGEDLEKVYNRLHDPQEFRGKRVLVVGGGDSALEASIALVVAGAHVTHSYRKPTFSRPKPDNVRKFEELKANPAAQVGVEIPTSERVTTSFTPAMCAHAGEGSICSLLPSSVRAIRDKEVVLADARGVEQTLPNDVVFLMIGREPPLDFFRRAGVPIRGEWRASTYISFTLFTFFCIFLYHWKKDVSELRVNQWFRRRGWFPYNVDGFFQSIGGWITEAANTSTHLLYTLRQSMSEPSFYYTLAYCVLVITFGIRRIRRRRTPYVMVQTIVLMSIQTFPLFLLPEIVLPWMGNSGWFSQGGFIGWIGQEFFPDGTYWHAYGLVLAWPLVFMNVITDQPMVGWLIISFLQTFVIIPLMIRRWGKGAYCSWICSCGALAETLGDAHRHKMPHGPIWNRLNMAGQVILVFAFVVLGLRIGSWICPESFLSGWFKALAKDLAFVNYQWSVDLMLAGVLGVACYFWFSGRVWCRFACPLAALMHIYARFTRFRIFAQKSKCISCNVCTSVCHQGIDVMNFANKGLPMLDPECVRCSACVQSCPTGVLTFGRFTADGGIVKDTLAASRVQLSEEGGADG